MAEQLTEISQRQKTASYMREWRAKNPTRAREISRAGNLKYRREKTEQYKVSYQRYNDKARAGILEFFGGKCIRCGFADPRALQMDHINGGGGEERRAGKLTLTGRYQLILKHPDNARARFQMLCANCNSIKRFENHEYGNGRPRKEISS